MNSLKSRISDRFASRGLKPVDELIRYATACDDYADLKIDSATMQLEMCTYLDASALRFRSLSEALGRVKEPSISEIVTESVTMLVDSIARSPALKDLQLEVSSERNVKLPVGGYRKPDVGIWKNDKLSLVVECKTCLGRRRKEWMDDYGSRLKEFESVGLSKEAFMLFVGTDTTWKGFPSGDPRVSKNWFSLCPVGTWYGSGKAGEVTLCEKQREGVVESFRNAIITLLTD